MSFLINHEWQLLFLFSSLVWILLLFREIYRYRLLVSRYGILTTFIALILIIIWILLFLYMCYRIGIWASILSYGVLFAASSLVLGIKRGTESSHNKGLYDSVLGKSTESTARYEWEEKTKESIIEKLSQRQNLTDVLLEYGHDMNFLQKLIDNYNISSDEEMLKKIANINTTELRTILDMYARSDWNDGDKIMGTLKYLKSQNS